MPEVKDEYNGEVDASARTKAGVEPWPSDGERDDKRATLARIREGNPSIDQAEVLRAALETNEDKGIANEIIGVILWIVGEQSDDDDGRHYTSAGIEREYVAALSRAMTTPVRIALHTGFAAFRPQGSMDGLINNSKAQALRMHLQTCRDPDEQGALISLLRRRAGWNDARLLEALNGWIDDEERDLTVKEVECRRSCKTASKR